MTTSDVVWTTVFAAAAGGGNPCPVVFGAAERSGEQMQAAAAEFGVETVFVLPAEHGGDARLRYFVPLHEMEMCVHATVAATVLLAERGMLTENPARIETALGPLDVSWDLGRSTATVSQFPPKFGPALEDRDRARVLAALGVAGDDVAHLVGPICSVSTARAKLMIPLRDEARLDRLRPDFPQLWAACDELAVTGFYPFTLAATGADAAARQFPQRSGYDEDPATGVAACGLGAYLATFNDASAVTGWNRWSIAQGRAIGRPSLMTVEAFRDPDAVSLTRVGGPVHHLADEDRPRL